MVEVVKRDVNLIYLVKSSNEYLFEKSAFDKAEVAVMSRFPRLGPREISGTFSF